MDKTMNMMVPLSVVTEAIDCAVDVYSDNSIIIERGNNRIDMTLDSNIISINQIVEEITTPPVKRGSVIYIPLNYILKAFGYSYSFDISENIATVINETPQERSLPYAYCYTDYGKVGEIKIRATLVLAGQPLHYRHWRAHYCHWRNIPLLWIICL